MKPASRMRFTVLAASILALACQAQPPRPPGGNQKIVPPAAAAEKIAWHGTMEAGLAAAKASGRPIFLLAAAPQCHGVSGIW